MGLHLVSLRIIYRVLREVCHSTCLCQVSFVNHFTLPPLAFSCASRSSIPLSLYELNGFSCFLTFVVNICIQNLLCLTNIIFHVLKIGVLFYNHNPEILNVLTRGYQQLTNFHSEFIVTTPIMCIYFEDIECFLIKVVVSLLPKTYFFDGV